MPATLSVPLRPMGSHRSLRAIGVIHSLDEGGEIVLGWSNPNVPCGAQWRRPAVCQFVVLETGRPFC